MWTGKVELGSSRRSDGEGDRDGDGGGHGDKAAIALERHVACIPQNKVLIKGHKDSNIRNF